MAVFSGLPDPAHLVPHHQSHEIEGSQREIRPGSSGRQRSGTSTDARRDVVQAGQQLLTSWIRPKMPSFVQLGTRVRGGQKLLTDWMRPKSRSAPTEPFASVSAMEHVSPIHEDGAEFFFRAREHSLSKFAYAGTQVQFGGLVSLAPEVVTGDHTLGKVTCPLHSGTTLVFVSCLYPHLVVSLVFCCC